MAIVGTPGVPSDNRRPLNEQDPGNVRRCACPEEGEAAGFELRPRVVMLFGGAHDVRLDLGVDVVQDGLEEGLLVLVVMVDGAARHPGRLGDLLQPYRLVAPGREHLTGYLPNRPAGNLALRFRRPWQ